MDLSARADVPELMDDADLDVGIYNRCLRDLVSVNRLTFTHGAILSWLKRVTRDMAPAKEISILDVAYGQGDLLRAIARWAARRGLAVRLSGIDLNPRSAMAAREATPGNQKIDFFTGDVFTYLPAMPVDFIVSSQFSHHLADDDVIRLLRWLEIYAVRGWFIADLHRHVLPYYGFRLLARLMFWHRIVRLDGTASIARSFTRAEWRSLLERAGIDAEISWSFPFRYGIGRLK